MPTVVDLFAGAGGFSLGFDSPTQLATLPYVAQSPEELEHPIQFETKYAVEYDKAAASTFDTNFESCTVLNKDITEVSSSEIESNCDILIGGPPCQGFSIIRAKSLDEIDDEKNSLWTQYYRLLTKLTPQVFIIENVPRFTGSDEFSEFQQIIESDTEYTLSYDTLNASDFGVPQNRNRTIIVGTKDNDTEFSLPSPNADTVSVMEAIGDLQQDPSDATDDPLHIGRRQAPITKKRMEQISIPGGDRRDLPDKLTPDCWEDTSGFTDSYGRMWPDKPSNTIRTRFNGPMCGRFVHPYANRVITPREAARLQSFPDSFEFSFSTKEELCNQIGNAVPPLFGHAIAREVAQYMLETNFE